MQEEELTAEIPKDRDAAFEKLMQVRADERFQAAYNDMTHPAHDLCKSYLKELRGVCFPEARYLYKQED